MKNILSEMIGASTDRRVPLTHRGNLSLRESGLSLQSEDLSESAERCIKDQANNKRPHHAKKPSFEME